jgi:asparagine synthase (glutamine-hydrolysing)
MCGIAGIVNFDPKEAVDTQLLRRMTDLVAHRGPDDAGHWIGEGIGLGHRRLSILDLSAAGHQPMSNEDGTLWIVYNGECYNYRELTKQLVARGHRFRSQSDTEAILRLYEERGIACLDEIDGMFAMAIWDGRTRSLVLARDRIGIKPLYYFSDARHLVFASELKALLADRSVPSEIDTAALGDFLHLLSIPDPRSIFSGVRKLLPGHYLVVHDGKIEERCYWDVTVNPDERMSFDEACGGFGPRFEAAVASHMVADVPVGAFLSGGVDSSSAVALASGISHEPLNTFSVTFPGLGEFDESRYAALVAGHCGTNHHEFNLQPHLVDVLPEVAWHADEPFAISSGFALYNLARQARKHVKVVLTGDGSDEIFGGYTWRHVDFAAETGARGMLRHFARLLGLRHGSSGDDIDEKYIACITCYGDRELDGLLTPAVAHDVAVAWRRNAVRKYLSSCKSSEQLARKLYADVKTTLVSEMLTKVDRMTMAHGLEARVPFLDHHLVEWAFTVPGRHKFGEGGGKRLVKRAMEPLLPQEILYRPKQGFNVPLKVWLRDELREFIQDQLSADTIARRGIFHRNAAATVITQHFEGKVDASNKIFAMLMLELWFKAFVDDRPALLASSASGPPSLVVPLE